MSDIVERLRFWAFKFQGKGNQETKASDFMSKAADEIVRLKAERDALLAAAEKGTEYVLAHINQDLKAERDALQATLDNYMDDHKAVVNEQCAGDEKHCSCVPHLRKRIKEVEAERDALLEALGDLLTFEPEHCPCGEHECEESQRAWGAARAAIDAARGEK